jgi:prephenate dehydrogenase
MPFTLRDAQVAVVGLGLMGGSLAAALSAGRTCRQVVGVARRPSTLTTALALRFIQRGVTDLEEGVREADLVILATPVRDILARIATIGPALKPGCVLLDVGSTKREICRAMEALPPHVQPIGGHPLCGKETSGLTMAEPDLYRDRIFVLAPLERTAPEALALAQELVAAIGGRPLLLDAARHDALVAAISHLPYLLAATLVNAAESLSGGDDLLWSLAAGGFRDTSRVAASSIPMMMDILTTNREPILDALRAAQWELSALTQLLQENDLAALQARLEAARHRRMEVFR